MRYFIPKNYSPARKFLAELKAVVVSKLGRKILARMQTLNCKCQLTPCGWCNWVWVIPLASEFNVRRTLTGNLAHFRRATVYIAVSREINSDDRYHENRRSRKEKARSLLRAEDKPLAEFAGAKRLFSRRSFDKSSKKRLVRRGKENSRSSRAFLARGD